MKKLVTETQERITIMSKPIVNRTAAFKQKIEGALNKNGKYQITFGDVPTPSGHFNLFDQAEPPQYSESDDFISHSHTEEVSFVEFAIINNFFFNAYKGEFPDINISSYGSVDGIGRIHFGGLFDITEGFWFNFQIKNDENIFYVQTKLFLNSNRELVTQFHLSSKKGMLSEDIEKIYNNIKKLAFNNSEYKGKCIQVKLRDGRFRGITIIDVEEAANELILTPTQRKFTEHFINRVGKGGNVRYLFNGIAGCGKTETIREIMRRLTPPVTFIIPDFTTSEDLTSIMEACEIFDSGVIVMDDIDLYLGSRENGNYTRLLGEFLSFFDGIKKRSISILASTNDKFLVDKASSRPGRFSFILDYTFLNDEQIIKVCDIHIEERWRVKEVYDTLTGRIDGKKVKVTGAFISNLADNLREMSTEEGWTLEDTLVLITESYKGFYSSNVALEKESMGFKNN